MNRASILLALAMVSSRGAAWGASQAPPTHPVEVRVIDVAGGRAYLEPGSADGLRLGAIVTIARQTFRVVDLTTSGCVINLGKQTLRAGDKGSSQAVAADHATRVLPTPPPLDHFRAQWKPARRPAASQRPRPRPLGPMRAASAVDVRLWAGAATITGPDGIAGRAELGARGSWDPWRAAGLDADGSAYVWFEGAPTGTTGLDARPVGELRELRIRWGARDAPLFAGGRLRWAAARVGPIDGARAAVTHGRLSLAVFGGAVPDPRSLEPATDAFRVGGEARWDDPVGRLRPAVALSVWGSHFDGALDERRVAASGRLEPGHLTVGFDAEGAAFDDGGGTGVELALGAVDVAVRSARAHGGLRVAYERPERSRYLDVLYGPSWTCTPRADGGCDRRARLAAVADAGYALSGVALSGGVAAIRATGGEASTDANAFGLARLLGALGRRWAEVGVSGTRGELLDQASGHVAVGGRTSRDALELVARYRPTRIVYRAGGAAILEHRAGLDAVVGLDRVGAELSLGFEGATGSDVRSLAIWSMLVWRGR